MTSTLIQLVSKASRANSAVSTASRAVSQPAVFGRKRRPFNRLTVSDARRSSEIRRIDMVTTSAPLASTASTRMRWFGYPAVPRKRREPSVTPAMQNGSDEFISASLHGADDFDTIAILQCGRGPLVLAD